eukprot:scaffold4060_cov121-Cylindrotheca_fusiformis.AAC.5
MTEFTSTTNGTTNEPNLGAAITGVLVEIRCHKGLLMSLQQSTRHFLKHKIPVVVWHSASNRNFLQSLIQMDPDLKSSWESNLLFLHEFDPLEYGFDQTSDHKGVHYGGSYWYQRLLKSPTFWKSISTRYMINLQSDSLVCRPLSQDDSFFSRLLPNGGPTINYLGGISGSSFIFDPATMNMIRRRYRVRETPSALTMASPFNFNGGFSLHSVAWTLDCIERCQTIPETEKYTEDQLWNFCRTQRKKGNDVTELDAYSFASNIGATKCFNSDKSRKITRTCPFGVHKPWKNKVVGSYSELEESCPGLRTFESLQGIFDHHETCSVTGMEKKILEIPCSCQL